MSKTLLETDIFDVIQYDDIIQQKHNIETVAILPYILDENGNLKDIGIVKEYNPSQDPKTDQTIITGTVDEHETYLDTAIRELKEESGYLVEDIEKWKSVGILRVGKTYNKTFNCFLVDVTNIEAGEITTDGSKAEQKNKFTFIHPSEIKYMEDSLLLSLFLKFFLLNYHQLF